MPINVYQATRRWYLLEEKGQTISDEQIRAHINCGAAGDGIEDDRLVIVRGKGAETVEEARLRSQKEVLRDVYMRFCMKTRRQLQGADFEELQETIDELVSRANEARDELLTIKSTVFQAMLDLLSAADTALAENEKGT